MLPIRSHNSSTNHVFPVRQKSLCLDRSVPKLVTLPISVTLVGFVFACDKGGATASEVILSAPTPASIVVNVESVLNDTSRRQIGINTDYWCDDQGNRAAGARPFDSALRELGVRFLRYPGGEKS